MIRPVVLLALALALAAAPAMAQSPADSTAARASDSLGTLPPQAVTPPPPAPANPASVLGPNSAVPTRPHLVFPRSQAVIGAERDQLLLVANSSDSDQLEAKKRVAGMKDTVEVKKHEIDTLNARAKAAKQAKDDATRTAFETERKRQESMRNFFVREQDVAEAAVDEAEARGEWAKAAGRVCDLELRLVGRAGVAAYDTDPSLFVLEQQYFEAAKARGAAQEKLASRTQTLVDRKLRLYRAWADYLSGK